MAGKRLAAAGALAAAVAATAALWVTQHTPLPSQLRAIRQAHTAIATVNIAHVRVSAALQTSQSVAQSPDGLPATAVVVLALMLVGTALRPQRATVPATPRPARRERAPPSPAASHHTARARGR
ncbi:MAG TPA: hypothetical protein VGP31_15340 [Planosporangium sp.]|nr:hypothetical protein [Planosporangium sp.]